jgi:photosystem II stability/assembly factor-like uncharacterized protein
MQKNNNIISPFTSFLYVLLTIAFLGSCNLTAKKQVVDHTFNSQNIEKTPVVKQDTIHQRSYVPSSLSNHFAVNTKTYWAIDPGRGIVRSFDGGKTWALLSLDNNAKLSQLFKYSSLNIFFTNELRGLITGNLQTWKTQDGGENWEQIFDKQINAIFFHNEKTGWINLTDEKESRSYKTEDSGETWKPCPQSTEKLHLKDTFFITPQIGWTFINKNYGGSTIGIAKTEDGGCHWHETWKGFNNKDVRYTDLFFINEKVGWISTIINNGLFQTQDGGKTWKSISIPNHVAQIETFFFKNDKEGWLLFASKPESPIYYKTYDGGDSWQPAPREELIQSFQMEIEFPRISPGLRRSVVIYGSNMN